MAVSWIPKSAYTPETFQKKGRVTIMTKKKLFKMLTLALALVTLFSVTAFAGSVSWKTSSKYSAQGSCSYASATTTVSSPTYIYAQVVFTYKYCTAQQTVHTKYSSSENMGVNIIATVSEPTTCFTYEYTHGYHRAEDMVSYISSSL